VTDPGTWSFGDVPARSYDGEGWRHLAPGYDPLSGEGARLRGGRFNVRESFPVLYLCTSRACVAAELELLGTREPVGLDGLLPRQIYRYSISLERVLDLTASDVRHALGVDVDSLVDADWSSCQLLGVTAHALGYQAIRSPSATRIDDVLAVLIQNLGRGRISPFLAATWTTREDLQGAQAD
jgi:RES domain-containing protein